MRFLLTLLASTAFLFPKAQTLVPVAQVPLPAAQVPVPPPQAPASPAPAPGWQLRPFTSVTAGYMFLGGGVSYFSAPVGIALYRPLNSHFTAFTAATIAPTVFHFNSLYGNGFADPYPGHGLTRAGWNAGVSGGLIYTNEAHTFSISGSISVERGSYPAYYVPRTRTATKQY